MKQQSHFCAFSWRRVPKLTTVLTVVSLVGITIFSSSSWAADASQSATTGDECSDDASYVWGIHEVELKESVVRADFESFVREEFAPSWPEFRHGMRVRILKSDRGERAKRYALAFVFESKKARSLIFPGPGKRTPLYKEALAPSAELWKKLFAYFEKGPGAVPFTSYQVIREESAGQKGELDGWGVFVDPDGDCLAKLSERGLNVSVPGSYHDLHPSKTTNSPRILQDVQGDFIATVKVTADWLTGEVATNATNLTIPPGKPFLAAGLILWQDEENFVRLERNIWRKPGREAFIGWLDRPERYYSYKPLFRCFQGGELINHESGSVVSDFFKGQSTQLRLKRVGSLVSAEVSHDGLQWTEPKSIEVDLPSELKIGVSVVNSTENTFSVEFSEFNVEALPKEPVAAEENADQRQAETRG